MVDILSINGKPTRGKLYVRFTHFSPQWKDTISFSGKLTKPYGVSLIGNFNWRTYLAQKGIFAEVKTADALLVKKAAWPYRIVRRVRQSILQTFQTHLPQDLASIASGLVLGERSELTAPLFTAFQTSGTIHLLVASGGNVGFVTLLLFMGCNVFSIPRKKALVLALIGAGFYTLLAGADAPLVRAYWMTLFVSLSYLLRRNTNLIQGLLVAAFMILLVRPSALFEVSFQMSFLATLGIIWGVANFPLPSSWPKGVRFFVAVFMASLCSQLFLLPIFANVFYKVSVVGLVANMLLVPFASGLLAVSVAYYAAELLHFGFLIYFPLLWGLQLFRFLVEFFASFSFSSFEITSWQPTTVSAYFIGLFLLFHIRIKAVWRKVGLLGILGIIILLGCSYANNQKMQIYLLDEWGKNVILFKDPSGQTFVFGTEIAPDKLTNALRKIGTQGVETMFAFSAKKPKQNLADFVPVAHTVIPFEQVWPEKEFTVGSVTVTLEWGQVCSHQGKCVVHKGYSGTKHDKTSYHVITSRGDFYIGANGSFVRVNDKLIFAQRNKTTILKI